MTGCTQYREYSHIDAPLSYNGILIVIMAYGYYTNDKFKFLTEKKYESLIAKYTQNFHSTPY